MFPSRGLRADDDGEGRREGAGEGAELGGVNLAPARSILA